MKQITEIWRSGCPVKALLLLFCSLPGLAYSHSETTANSPVQISKEGKLSYKSASNGDRVPDFSFCGFMASEKAIPDVAVKVIISPGTGDTTERIQQSIDYVSSLPLDRNGFRGAVLLEKGTFEIAGGLTIKTSGVVLSGSGCTGDGTILQASGFDRKSLIRIAGVNNKITAVPVQVSDQYIPVNSTILPLKMGHSFQSGDLVMVTRPSAKEWLEQLGADKIGIYVDYTLTKWEPGDFDLKWYRKVIAVTPISITLDVPLTNSLDPKYGGGYVAKYSWDGQIRNTGVENLHCISTYDPANLKDENHRWKAITLENVSDSWVRRVVAEHFVSSAVAVWETARRITVEDCKSLDPVGEIGSHRRYSFHTLGQQVLFQRCYAEFGYHAFSVGFTTSGPNAFVQCYSFMPHNFSGAIGGWSAGVLFDIMTIDGGSISLAYRDVDGQGGGWSAANSLCWRCRAAQIHLPAPPGAQNCAYASWAQGYGDGHHELQHTFVKPESFYYAQLEARTGKKSPEEEKILVIESKETTAPFYEQPFSRSGEGEAFDRLSKYDLTKWNTWYWLRLRQFADLADQKGLIFTQEHYLQHNIIEEGAHWVDYPWRSDNNVNDPGFAENPHYAGDKRVYMAVEFYDTTNLVRKAFHRAYIRKSLDNFKGNTNIIHHLGNEYTGPLHFVQFWLDVIAGWEKENQTKLLVMLPGTKDVQDAVLSDPKRAAMVNIVDVIQWHNRKDGSLYAPPGGVSLAGRQYARIYEVGETSFAQIYRAVSELHLMYPDKAIVYNSQGTTLSDWAVFMAGGSLTSIPLIRDGGFLKAAAKMSPLVVNHRDTQQYVLGKRGVGYILFSKNQKVKFDLAGDTTVYPLKWINPVTGDVFPDNAFVTGGLGTSLSAPFQGSSVAWLCK